jgi:hypothetical protein
MKIDMKNQSSSKIERRGTGVSEPNLLCEVCDEMIGRSYEDYIAK